MFGYNGASTSHVPSIGTVPLGFRDMILSTLIFFLYKYYGVCIYEEGMSVHVCFVVVFTQVKLRMRQH